jgi:hypothetical protein
LYQVIAVRAGIDFTASLANVRLISSRSPARSETETQARLESKGENEMRMDKFVGNAFLKVDDIKASGPIRRIITKVSEGSFGKPDITFEDGTQLSSNKTNCSVLARAYGMESDNWIDKEVELTVSEMTYNGEPQETIRVKPITPPIAKKTPPPSEFGNAIPF